MIRKMKKILSVIATNTFLANIAFAASGCPDKNVGGVDVKGFKSVFSDDCLYSYQGWITAAWEWTMVILIPLSIIMLTAAGILYMTSEGDSGRITTAKKLIIGVLSGVGLLILARLLLIGVIGVEETYYEEFTINLTRLLWI